MGHNLQALIFAPPSKRAAFRRLDCIHVRQLRQSMFLVPVTDELFDQVGIAWPSDVARPFEAFWKLSGSLLLLAQRASEDGAVAYVETEYFGGVGSQAAAAWDKGDLLLAPTRRETGPLNEALRLLGVRPSGAKDQFQAVGLDEHRETNDWLKARGDPDVC